MRPTIVIPRVPFIADTYGFLVDPKKARHPLCQCLHACQMRFRCQAKKHRGKRATPWCCGGDGESCNECWAKADAKKGRAA